MYTGKIIPTRSDNKVLISNQYAIFKQLNQLNIAVNNLIKSQQILINIFEDVLKEKK